MPPVTENPASAQEISALLEQALREGRFTLPVMPEIAVRVSEAVQRQGVGARDLARIIEASPGLSARVLRMANSAMYAGLCEIVDLAQAIGRLGVTMVLVLVIGAAGKETFRSNDATWAGLLERAWMSAIFASVAARLVGVRAGEIPEECFLAGLFHSIGEPILVQAAERLSPRGTPAHIDAMVLREAIEPLIPAAGARLLASWGLPEKVALAVAHQRDGALAPPGTRLLAAATGLAGAFGRQLVNGCDPRQSAQELSEEAGARFLEMDFDDLEPIFVQSAEDGSAIAQAL